jgi:uncharacterized protein YqcC (DUF446 family)
MDRTTQQESVAAQLAKIELEMRAIGLWQDAPIKPGQLQFSKAFAMDTMTFQQWLQFVFIPRVREAIENNSFPNSSSVGAQAVREFDTVPEALRLTSLLAEFDALF